MIGSKRQNKRTFPQAYLNQTGLKASHAEEKAGLNHRLRYFNTSNTPRTSSKSHPNSAGSVPLILITFYSKKKPLHLYKTKDVPIKMNIINCDTFRLLQSFFKKQNQQCGTCKTIKTSRMCHFIERLELCCKSFLTEVEKERQACRFCWSVLLLR